MQIENLDISKVQSKQLSLSSKEYNFFLADEVKANYLYTNFISFILNLCAEDVVNLYISSPGGLVSTSLDIINAIKKSKATFNGIVTSHACSAAASILMACDNKDVRELAYVMFHEASGGVFGGQSHSKLKYQYEHVKTHNEYVTRKMCQDILTNKEIDSLLKGKDFYLTAKEFNKRISKL